MGETQTPIARGVAVLVAGIVGYAAKHGTTLDPETVTTIMLAVYGGVHSLIRHFRKK